MFENIFYNINGKCCLENYSNSMESFADEHPQGLKSIGSPSTSFQYFFESKSKF